MGMTAKSTRHQLLDVAKGIAILLVLVGHTIQYASGKSYSVAGDFYENYLFKFIYGFHMPLFMIVSGYLFSFAVKKKSTKEIVISRLTSLLIPIFSFAFVVYCVKFNSGLCLFDQIRRFFVYYQIYIMVFVGIAIFILWSSNNQQDIQG